MSGWRSTKCTRGRRVESRLFPSFSPDLGLRRGCRPVPTPCTSRCPPCSLPKWTPADSVHPTYPHQGLWPMWLATVLVDSLPRQRLHRPPGAILLPGAYRPVVGALGLLPCRLPLPVAQRVPRDSQLGCDRAQASSRRGGEAGRVGHFDLTARPHRAAALESTTTDSPVARAIVAATPPTASDPYRQQPCLGGINELPRDRLRPPESLMPADRLLPDPWVSIEEVLLHLGVARNICYRWINKNGLLVHRVGRLRKFQLAEIEAWVRSVGAAGDDETAS